MPTKNYVDAWAAMRLMILQNGLSWSGREKDHLFLNLGDRSFAEFSAISAADSIGDGRALALSDWDDDGRLDLLLKNRTAPRLQFFRNQLANPGHFVAVSLTGVRCNRDAIGALVEVEAGGRVLRQRLHAGEGYLAQSSKRLHFGLARAERIERLTVRWPDGSTDSFEDLAVDERYHLTQGDRAPRRVSARAAPALASAVPEVPQGPRNKGRRIARVPLVEKLPLAALTVPSYEDPSRTVADLAGGPALLNLWGTSCAPCLAEFAELQEHRTELERLGLRFVALATDAPDDRARAREVLARFGLQRDAGYADPALLQALEPLLKEVLQEFEVVPLPTSLLLDAKGQLVALYLGPLEVEQLLGDVAALAQMNPENLSATRLLGGFRLIRRGRDFAGLAAAFERLERPELAAYYRGFARE